MRRTCSLALAAALALSIGSLGPAGSARAANRPAKKTVDVTGKTACAHCKFGKTPISDPDSMGIAVENGAKVYIVEGGEKKYPKIFEDRFDAIAVELKGKVKKTEDDAGKEFIWVEPSSLEVVQK